MVEYRQSVANSWINGPNIQIGSVGGNVLVALDRPEYQLQWLQPAGEPSWVPRHQRTPSYLLDTRRAIVPYRPRVAEQTRLWSWLTEPDIPMSVLLLHGPGGQGKTRLANAFSGAAHAAGRAVAQAVHRTASPHAVLDTPANDEVSRPVLVAIDYAERWDADALLTLISRLPTDYPARPVRVLLIARSRADLWPVLSEHLDRLPTDLADPVELRDLATTPGERRDAFQDAAAAFQSALDVPPGGVATPDLSDPTYGSALMLHMTALAAVCAARDHEPSPELADLSRYLLRHEGRFWPGNTPDPATGITRTQATDAVFLATLFGPTVDADTACALLTHAQVADTPTARAILTWHDRLYPDTPTSPHPALAPLRPDRFGEDFIADHLTTHPRALDLLSRALNVVDPAAIRHALIVLAAAADRDEHTRQSLWSLITRHPSLGRHASPSLITTAINHAPYPLCGELMNQLPRYRTDLLRSSVHLTQHLLDALPANGSPAIRAALLNNLGNRLADAGDKQAAPAPAREAATIYRLLAKTDPALYLADLAMSLTNLGNQMAGAGDRTAALEPGREAVTIYRQLAKTDPAVYLADVATCLNNLGILLAQVGEKQAALEPGREAVTIYRQLAKTDPVAYLPKLAMGLNNLGNQLAQVGERQAALESTQEAVAIRRRLAKTDPAAYLPTLATGLSNLGLRLAEIGDKQAALAPSQEAISIRRQLANADPAAFLPDLAESCWALAWGQTADGEPLSIALPAAWDSVQTAIDIYEQLVKRWPLIYGARLVSVFRTAVKVLDAMGRTAEADEFREQLKRLNPESE